MRVDVCFLASACEAETLQRQTHTPFGLKGGGADAPGLKPHHEPLQMAAIRYGAFSDNFVNAQPLNLALQPVTARMLLDVSFDATTMHGWSIYGRQLWLSLSGLSLRRTVLANPLTWSSTMGRAAHVW